VSTKPVVVYGASGYTGRLICEYLRELNVPFVAAGRNKDLLQEVVGRSPGNETADHDIVEVEHTVEALTDLFTGAKVVCNTVGPFIKHGFEVAEACLATGAHYLDTTGEQDWVMAAQERFGTSFADQGLLLAPGIAQMYTTGEIAANIALETPGIETLDILVLWKGFPTYASTQTIFTILTADWFTWSTTSTWRGTTPPRASASSPASMPSP
jgi:saccharopine dehydrogenase-like NADP-dependent oxidoreductase